jgi:drug/metabolite transporter (DMT)-like permease
VCRFKSCYAHQAGEETQEKPGVLHWPDGSRHEHQKPTRMRPFFQAVVVFVVSIVSLSVGNILLKMGMDRFGALTASGIPALQALVKSPQLPVGVVLMTVQFIGTLTLFKWGWDASVVVPVMGLCYVGTAMLGKWLLGEPVNALRWLGIFLIILGVFFIARSVTQAKVP